MRNAVFRLRDSFGFERYIAPPCAHSDRDWCRLALDGRGKANNPWLGLLNVSRIANPGRLLEFFKQPEPIPD
jgi:hypothetical protein